MKYLLFSDIHGCLPALEKALDFFEQSHCDMMCIMGDIINYGPRNRIPESISTDWQTRLSPCVATVMRRSIRCCSNSQSWRLTPCWWMVASATSSLMDIYIIRRTCQRDPTMPSSMDILTFGNFLISKCHHCRKVRHLSSASWSIPAVSPSLRGAIRQL